MAGNYEQNMYKQLMEVMSRLDAVEKDLRDEKTEHKDDVDRLNKKKIVWSRKISCYEMIMQD